MTPHVDSGPSTALANVVGSLGSGSGMLVTGGSCRQTCPGSTRRTMGEDQDDGGCTGEPGQGDPGPRETDGGHPITVH